MIQRLLLLLSVLPRPPVPGSSRRSRLASGLSQVDDLFALKTSSDPQVSPDGKWVAYSVSDPRREGRRRPTRTSTWSPLAGGEAVRLTTSKKAETHAAVQPRRQVDRVPLRAAGQAEAGLPPEPRGRRGGEVDLVPRKRLRPRLVPRLEPPGPGGERPRPPRSRARGGREEADEHDAPPKKAKTPLPLVIRRRQFKRDGEGYLGEVRRHLHVFDVASPDERPGDLRSARRRESRLVAGRTDPRLREQPHDARSRRQPEHRRVRGAGSGRGDPARRHHLPRGGRLTDLQSRRPADRLRGGRRSRGPLVRLEPRGGGSRGRRRQRPPSPSPSTATSSDAAVHPRRTIPALRGRGRRQRPPRAGAGGGGRGRARGRRRAGRAAVRDGAEGRAWSFWRASRIIPAEVSAVDAGWAAPRHHRERRLPQGDSPGARRALPCAQRRRDDDRRLPHPPSRRRAGSAAARPPAASTAGRRRSTRPPSISSGRSWPPRATR